MRSRLSNPCPTRSAKFPDLAVRDDLAGLPVTEAEIDAVEAFLRTAFRELLAKDWEVPPTHAEIGTIPASRRRRP